MEVEVSVDAVALEGGDEIIEPVKLVGVKFVLLGRARLPDAAGRRLVVGVVKADAVDPETGQTRG